MLNSPARYRLLPFVVLLTNVTFCFGSINGIQTGTEKEMV